MRETTRSDGTGTEVVAEPLPASLPGYDLLEEVGRGGMGVVCRARDLALDREVAVKILQEKFPADSPTAARFVEEARITAQLQHPGIPAVYQVGALPDGRPFLAMKLIKGETLDALLKAGAPLDRLAVLEAVARAVGYAHAHRVIHRDLKPANVMVGRFGEVQVMDWGLAKVLDGRPREAAPADPEATVAHTGVHGPRLSDTPFTQYGSVLGTPAYMAPEQAAGELDKIDYRSDVFGVGAILCALLTGHPPFGGTDADSIRLAAVRGHCDEALARLDASGADPDVVALCKRCLAFDPAARPRSAAEVADAVAAMRQAADERARQAERDRMAAEVRAAEQGKRRRLTAWAAAAVAAVLLLGISGTWWGMLRANDARDAAEGSARAAQDAEKRAEANAVFAAEQRHLTLDALRVLVVEVQEQLADQPGTRQLKRELLSAALTTLEPLARTAERSPAADLRTAQAHLGLGEIFLQAGQREQAGEQFEKGRAIVQKVAEADGAVAEARRELGIAYRHLGTVKYRDGRAEEARKFFEQSREILRKLLKEDDKDSRTRREFVLTQDDLGEVVNQVGDAAGSRDVYQEGVDEARKLHEADPRDAQARALLAGMLSGLAESHRRLGTTERAGSLAEEALAAIEPVAKTDGKKIAVRKALGGAHLILGQAREASGKSAEALASYEAALKQAEALAEADDDYASRRNLSVVLNHLGDVCQYLGKSREARDHLTRSLEVMEGLRKLDPHGSRIREDQGLATLRLSRATAALGDTKTALDHARAAKDLFAPLVELAPDNTDFARYLLSAWLELGTIQYQTGELTRAIESLREAVGLGEKLVGKDGKNVILRQDLYVSLNRLGDVYLAREAYAEARDQFRRSLEHNEYAAKVDEKNLDARRDLALCKGRMSDAVRGLGNAKDAAALMREAASEFRALVKADPNNLEFRRDLGSSLLRMGLLEEGRRRADAAEKHYAEGVELFEKLVKADPSSARFRQDLLVVCNKAGDLRLMALGDREASHKYYEKAKEQVDWRAAKDRRDVEARGDVVLQHMRFGRHAMFDGRLADAVGQYEKALEQIAAMEKDGLLKDAPAHLPGAPAVKQQLAICQHAIRAVGDPQYALTQGAELVQPLLRLRVVGLCREGKHEEAAASVAKLHETGPKKVSVQFDVARGYGRCAAAVLRDRKPDALTDAERKTLAGYRSRALDALERAIDLGFDGKLRLDADSDLAALRGEEAFQKLADRLSKQP